MSSFIFIFHISFPSHHFTAFICFIHFYTCMPSALPIYPLVTSLAQPKCCTKTERNHNLLNYIYKNLQHFLSVQWHRWCVTGLPVKRSGFSPRQIHEGFVLRKVALGYFFLTTSVFPCQYHVTNAPYSYIIPLLSAY
jgi:hypothetical protein